MSRARGAVVLLVALVFAYSRAGRFAPPQIFFKASSYLLYALCVVFAGQGVAALQLTGIVPVHALSVPSFPSLGVHSTPGPSRAKRNVSNTPAAPYDRTTARYPASGV